MRELKEDKSYFNKVCLSDFSSPLLSSLSLIMRMFLSPGSEDTIYMGILSPVFRKKKEGQSAFLAFAVFQMSLTQIINMPKWHILGWHVLNSFK